MSMLKDQVYRSLFTGSYSLFSVNDISEVEKSSWV